jgi:selenide, water dikinase
MAPPTLLNRIGAELAQEPAVHAMTDVTGFGLLGHGLEMARGSNLRLIVALADVPMLLQAQTLARDRLVTGASHRNWESYGAEVAFVTAIEDWQRQILTDPQTSGGLLVSCAADEAPTLLRRIIAAGYSGARIIGRVEFGTPGITVAA